MDLAFYINEYLNQYGRVEVPGFGIFTLSKKNAMVDEQASKILPPKQIIHFEEKKSVYDSSLSKYIVEQTNENLFVVQTQIRDTVAQWNNALTQSKYLTIQNIGEFSFFGERILLNNSLSKEHPKYFGLEEIDLQKLKINKENRVTAQKNYQFSNSILWAFLVVIPIGALAYLGMEHQDLIFGKSSLENFSVQTSTQRIPEKPKVAVPVVKDSVRIDSIQTEYPTKKALPSPK